jgi:hypothetical protein
MIEIARLLMFAIYEAPDQIQDNAIRSSKSDSSNLFRFAEPIVTHACEKA